MGFLLTYILPWLVGALMIYGTLIAMAWLDALGALASYYSKKYRAMTWELKRQFPDAFK